VFDGLAVLAAQIICQPPGLGAATVDPAALSGDLQRLRAYYTYGPASAPQAVSVPPPPHPGEQPSAPGAGGGADDDRRSCEEVSWRRSTP